MTTLRYTFPNREQRNRFLKLIAMNVGQYGYGFGLEFEGLEFSLEQADGRGDLVSHSPPRAKGKWELRGPVVELDCTFFAGQDGFEKKREKIWDIACQFGASR